MAHGFLIDPVARTITAVECDVASSLEPAYALLDCEYVEVMQLGGNTIMLVDEEAMARPYHDQGHFCIGPRPDAVGPVGSARPVRGRGLVLGVTGAEMTDARIKLETLENAIRFITPEAAAYLLSKQNPLFG